MAQLCHRESSDLDERLELGCGCFSMDIPAVPRYSCCCVVASCLRWRWHDITIPKEPVRKVEPHVLAAELEGLTVVRHGGVLGGVKGAKP
uniref:Uncharacterized protein n=1 Tax=Oryza meridionalis TaxID=40149 RepID=A0A0E0E2U1_9ORYZ